MFVVPSVGNILILSRTAMVPPYAIIRDVIGFFGYEWAGHYRTVNISMGGHLFGLANFLERSLPQVLTKLTAENGLVPIPLPAAPPAFSAS
jgi:hypothetical protein